MSAKHTPGPWVTEKSGSVIWIGTPRSNGQKVDEIVTHIEIDLTYKTEVIEKKLADAKLIAAAPEMFDLLKKFLSTGYYGTDVGRKAIDLINSIEQP